MHRAFALVAALAAAAFTAHAGLIDPGTELQTVPMQVSVTGQAVAATGNYSMQLMLNGESIGVSGSNPSGSLDGQSFSNNPVAIAVCPEVSYQVTVSVSNFQAWTFGFTPPPGFHVYLDGIAQAGVINEETGATYSGNRVFQFCLHRDGFGSAAGVSTRITPNPFFFAVGLGNLSSGLSAGAISVYGNTRLTATCPEFSPEIQTQSDSTGTRRVLTPQTFVYFSDITNGFQMDFYPASAAGAVDGNGFYTIQSGATPYMSYQVTYSTIGSPVTYQKYLVTRFVGTTVLTNTVAGMDAAGDNVTLMEYGSSLDELPHRVIDQTNQFNPPWRTETTVVSDSSSSPAKISSQTQRIYYTFPWGPELTQEIDDLAGHQYTTNYTYNNTTGELLSITYPNGNWKAFDYYQTTDYRNGQIKDEYNPWLGMPASPSTSAGSGHVISYTYAADWSGSAAVLASRTEYINGTTIGQRQITNSYPSAPNGQTVWMQSISDSTGTGSTLTSAVRTFCPLASIDYVGLPSSRQSADGTMTSYACIPGTYNPANQTFTASTPGPDLELITVNGVTQAGGGASQFSSLAQTPIDSIYLVPNQSTETISYWHGGLMVDQQNFVFNGSGFSALTSTSFSFTPSGKPAGSSCTNGATTTATWSNEFLTSTTDAAGTTLQYTPDDLQRVVTSVKEPGPGYSGSAGASPPSGTITTTYGYDSDDNVVKTTISSAAGLSVSSSSTFDQGGQPASDTDMNGLTTSHAIYDGGLVETDTLPSGATVTTTRYPEGNVQSVTGTGQVPQYYSYSLDSNESGFIITKVNRGYSGSGDWSEHEVDWCGRPYSDTVPNSAGGTIVKVYTYNSLGQRIKAASSSSQGSVAPTLYSYTPMGALEVTALDVNGNGTIDLSGPDRVSQTDTSFAQHGDGSWWLTTTNEVYAGQSTSTPTVVGVKATRMSGFASGTEAEQETTDADGNTADAITNVNASACLVTTTTSLTSGAIANSATSVVYNGYEVQATSAANVTTTTGYDALGRPASVTDPRTGAVNTTYVANTNEIQQVVYANANLGTIANYSYDSAGRVASQSDNAGNVKAFSYDAMNRVVGVSVNGIATVAYSYGSDLLGRLQSQTTYFGANVDQSGGAGPGQSVTNFTYFGDLSLLQSKIDPAGATATFTYDTLNRLATQTDARGAIITIGYDPNTSELLTKCYSLASGATLTTGNLSTNLTFSYNRAGEVATVSDAAGTRSFNYASDLQLYQEVLPSYFGSNRALTYVHDTGNVVGRLTDFQVGNTNSAPTTLDADQETHFNYDSPTGRLTGITANGGGQSSYSFNYSFTPQTNNLVASLSATTPNSGAYAVAVQYDPYRNLVSSQSTSFNGTAVAAYAYTFTGLGQILTATESGSAFTNYGGSPSTAYLYDGFGQLTSAKMSLAGSNMSGRLYSYAYDAAGNRLAAGHNGSGALEAQFTPNVLNQIASNENITIPVQGLISNSSSKVGVQSTMAGQQGNFWASEGLLANGTAATPAPAYGTVSVYAGLASGDSGAGIAEGVNVTAFIGPFVESPTYDAAGNLTSDGRWAYTWDSENRLLSMQTNSAAQATGLPPVQLSFVYDYAGRRIQKTVTSGGITTQVRYIYNGSKVVAQISASSYAVQQHFFWGLALAGGQAGDLLMIQDTASAASYLPGFDGHGNLAVLLNGSNGTLGATYEYTPFGELLQKSGSYAIANPIRWASQWMDDETNLVYYGHRYYKPSSGRFISRDPMGERGGLNLYGFCGNDGINSWDRNGFAQITNQFYGSIAQQGPSSNTYEVYLNNGTQEVVDKSAYNQVAAQNNYWASFGVNSGSSGNAGSIIMTDPLYDPDDDWVYVDSPDPTIPLSTTWFKQQQFWNWLDGEVHSEGLDSHFNPFNWLFGPIAHALNPPAPQGPVSNPRPLPITHIWLGPMTFLGFIDKDPTFDEVWNDIGPMPVSNFYADDSESATGRLSGWPLVNPVNEAIIVNSWAPYSNAMNTGAHLGEAAAWVSTVGFGAGALAIDSITGATISAAGDAIGSATAIGSDAYYYSGNWLFSHPLISATGVGAGVFFGTIPEPIQNQFDSFAEEMFEEPIPDQFQALDLMGHAGERLYDDAEDGK